MKTNDRSKEAQGIIKSRLSNYFTEEQLSYLDDLGIEILNDYFSNHELRDLQSAQPAVIKGYVDRNQSNEVKRRLTHIGEDELGELMGWYKENCSEIEEVYDPQAQAVIALEVKHKTLKNSPKVHWDGRFIVAIGDRLASTRTRLDGVVGYQSALQVEDPDFVKKWSAFYDDREAKFKVYKDKVEKHKAAHDKKVKAAIKKHEKDMAAHQKKEQAIIGKLTGKHVRPGVKQLPKPPELKLPEYQPLKIEFVEPERPEIPQYMPPLDSRWSDVETEVIPEEHIMSSITNDDIIKVKQHIDGTGYKKPVRKVKEGYNVGGFILRKVK